MHPRRCELGVRLNQEPGRRRPAPPDCRGHAESAVLLGETKSQFQKPVIFGLLWIQAGPKTASRCVKSRPSLSSRGHFKTNCLSWVNYAHQEVTALLETEKAVLGTTELPHFFTKLHQWKKPEATIMNSFKWVHLTILKKSFAQTFSESFLYWPVFFKRPYIIAFQCFSGHTGSPELEGHLFSLRY